MIVMEYLHGVSKLELASELVTYRIVTVPIALGTFNRNVTIHETNPATEITKVINATPKIVRIHGRNHAVARHRFWLVLFLGEQVLPLGISLFDEPRLIVS